MTLNNNDNYALTYLNSKNLKFLDITWCSITRKAIREFQEKYTNVRIKHGFRTLNEPND